MKVINTFSAPLPMIPGVWPTKSNKRKVTEQMSERVQEPVRIGHYLEPLIGIAGKPDRKEILRAYFSSGQ